jgi:hypothetical protein
MSQFLNDDDVLAWQRDGFLIKEGFADDATLDLLRNAYEEVLAGEAVGDRMLGGITRQVMVPSMSHPVFDDNPLVERGREVVRRLYGTTDAVRVFDMLIYKPAGHPHETPWHQDMSYAGMPYAPAGAQPIDGLVQFWVPLDDVDEENGCMQFMPGQHTTPLLPHMVASGEPDDPARLLAIVDPEKHLDLTARAVAKLPAGGVTMHGYGTPHYTGPNRTTDRPRRAYIFNMATVEAHEALIAPSR